MELPAEVLELIFAETNAVTLMRIRQTCRMFKQVVDGMEMSNKLLIWKKFFYSSFAKDCLKVLKCQESLRKKEDPFFWKSLFVQVIQCIFVPGTVPQWKHCSTQNMPYTDSMEFPGDGSLILKGKGVGKILDNLKMYRTKPLPSLDHFKSLSLSPYPVDIFGPPFQIKISHSEYPLCPTKARKPVEKILPFVRSDVVKLEDIGDLTIVLDEHGEIYIGKISPDTDEMEEYMEMSSRHFNLSKITDFSVHGMTFAALSEDGLIFLSHIEKGMVNSMKNNMLPPYTIPMCKKEVGGHTVKIAMGYCDILTIAVLERYYNTCSGESNSVVHIMYVNK